MCPSLGLGVTAGRLYLDAAVQGCCPYEARNGGWEEGAGSSSLPSIPASRQPSTAWLFPSFTSSCSQWISAGLPECVCVTELSSLLCPCMGQPIPQVTNSVPWSNSVPPVLT